MGYDAICPNLYWREAPGAAPDDAAATARANGGVPDERLVGDVGGAAAYLRSLPTSNGKVGVIGYCSGGRQSVLAACNLDLDAAVDCYGAFVTGTPPEDFPLKVTNLVDQLPNLRCPLLGLFGNEDTHPSPGAGRRARADPQGRTASPTSSTATTAPGTRFFAVDRPSYRPEAANDGWEHDRGLLRASTWELTAMCTYATIQIAGRRQREGPGQQLVQGHRRHRLLRPPGARDGRAHAQHRLRRPGQGPGRAGRARAHGRVRPRADGRDRDRARQRAGGPHGGRVVLPARSGR